MRPLCNSFVPPTAVVAQGNHQREETLITGPHLKLGTTLEGDDHLAVDASNSLDLDIHVLDSVECLVQRELVGW